MKTNELRIGNGIMIRNTGRELLSMAMSAFEGTGEEWQFVKVNLQILEWLERGSIAWEIQPITLTEEWFIRFGFKKNISFYRIIGSDKALEVGLNNDTSEIQYYCYFRNFNKGGADDFVLLRKDLKYVHELQNLFFALTGEELTIVKEKAQAQA